LTDLIETRVKNGHVLFIPFVKFNFSSGNLFFGRLLHMPNVKKIFDFKNIKRLILQSTNLENKVGYVTTQLKRKVPALAYSSSTENNQTYE